MNSGGLVVTVIDGKAYTVGVCLGNKFQHFRGVISKFEFEPFDVVKLFHEKSGKNSTIISPTHIHGIIVKADTFWKKLIVLNGGIESESIRGIEF
jgi:hypothetical protein